MEIQKIATSRFGVGLGLVLGRITPTKLGYSLSRWFADRIIQFKSSAMVEAVRKNQWVIRGGNLTSNELEMAVRDVFRHAGRCFVDLYSSLHDPEKIKKKVSYGTAMAALIKNSQEKSFGAFIVAPHLSNFDLCILAVGYDGLRAQILTYGQPTGGYQIQNKIRLQTGLEIIPVNRGVHEKAVDHMRNGGLVITGVDRPIRRKTHMLTFFNRPSPLPAGHIRMAIEAEVPILVASASMDREGQYHIHLSEPIHLQRKNDPQEEIRLNGERVLTVIEDRIRKKPGQWLMFYPAWPEVEINPPEH